MFFKTLPFTGWIGGEFGGGWIYVYVRMSSFSAHLKLSQHLFVNRLCCCCCCCSVASIVSDSVQPHRRQPTRLPRPWDSPGKNTGVGLIGYTPIQNKKLKKNYPSETWCPLSLRLAVSVPHVKITSVVQSVQVLGMELKHEPHRGMLSSHQHCLASLRMLRVCH